MVPRVFISSTYYDLKHVRERIESFIENYGFEPVLFESDKVTYQQGKPIDQSAYHEVSLCHIMVLIVGGRYGSPSTNSSEKEERTQYDNFFISITRREFETAQRRGIPIIIFIDKNVFAEFQTYKNNVNYFNQLSSANFNFAHVDSINVFKFIEHIISLPIKTFEKVEEIENYLKFQFAGYFYLYLESLKNKSDNERIFDSISELNNIALRMNAMLTSVGEEVLKSNEDKYKEVIHDQLKIIIDYFISEFSFSIKFYTEETDDNVTKSDIENFAQILYYDTLKPALGEHSFKRFGGHLKVRFDSYSLSRMNVFFHTKVLPFIKSEDDERFIIAEIKKLVEQRLNYGGI